MRKSTIDSSSPLCANSKAFRIVSVQAETLKVCGFLLAHVILAVADKGIGHPIAHHLGFDIDAIGPAQGHCAAIAVLRPRLAGDGVTVHQVDQVFSGDPASRPAVRTGLMRFRCVYPPEAIGRACHLDRVAVHYRLTCSAVAQQQRSRPHSASLVLPIDRCCPLRELLWRRAWLRPTDLHCTINHDPSGASNGQ
jgi:hypothetical protein